jgi:hypothetical protein
MKNTKNNNKPKKVEFLDNICEVAKILCDIKNYTNNSPVKYVQIYISPDMIIQK